MVTVKEACEQFREDHDLDALKQVIEEQLVPDPSEPWSVDRVEWKALVWPSGEEEPGDNSISWVNSLCLAYEELTTDEYLYVTGQSRRKP